MEKILVIGGTGNIGLPTIKYLVKQNNVEVVAGVYDIELEKDKLSNFPDIELKKFDF